MSEAVFPLLALGVTLLLVWWARDGLEKGRKKRVEKPQETTERRIPAEPTVPDRAFDAKSAHAPSKRRCVTGRAYVVDGDTIVIRKVQIRLFGIDAPEIDHPFGAKAKWALVALCKGRSVRAEILEEDHHGRTVARCYLPDGRDVSAEMVKQGMAIDWPKFSGGIYRALEMPDARKRLWLADARQKGRMHVWAKFEERRAAAGPKG